MGRILGIDVGTIRIGLAVVSRPHGVPEPLPAVLRANGSGERAIIKMLGEYRIELIIIGLPLSADNKDTPQCENVRTFGRRLSRRLSVPIEYQDEYLSSFEATELWNESSSRKFSQRNTGEIDSLAACIILKDYLNNKAIA